MDSSLKNLQQTDCRMVVCEWIQSTIKQIEDKQVKRYLSLVLDNYVDRFCVYYKHNADATIKGLQETLKWREQNQIFNSINNFEYQEWDKVQKAYPHGYHGLTKDHHPIFIQRLGFVNMNAMKQQTTKERFYKRCYQSFEYSIQVRYNMIKELYGVNITKSIIIIDLKQVNALTNNIDIIKTLKKMSKISSKHYPGNTAQIYIINIPSIIKTTWDVFKLAFPEEMTKLITILDSNYLQELEKIIDSNNIPHYLGGKCYCQLPNSSKNDLYNQLNLYCTETVSLNK